MANMILVDEERLDKLLKKTSLLCFEIYCDDCPLFLHSCCGEVETKKYLTGQTDIEPKE
jgi:hypothetical protein